MEFSREILPKLYNDVFLGSSDLLSLGLGREKKKKPPLFGGAVPKVSVTTTAAIGNRMSWVRISATTYLF